MNSAINLARKYGRQTDFTQLLKVLKRQRPDRPVLFELFMNDVLYSRVTGETPRTPPGNPANLKLQIDAFAALGYDYASVSSFLLNFAFPRGQRDTLASCSINAGAVISDRATCEKYAWPNPDNARYDLLEQAGEFLEEGQKLIVFGPNGLLENVIGLVGYDNLCLMLADDPDLAKDVCDRVGSRLTAFYAQVAALPTVGACIVNDDWGFKTQTMLAPATMRQYIFPWHKKMVAALHAAGKPAILHSCGYPHEIMDDIVDDIKFDGKHSYEDNIQPVEQAYEQYGRRIAVMGGIDLDFICRSTPAEIKKRSKAMLAKAAERGGYALGSGNSIPEYVPYENYLAMIEAAMED